MLIGCVFLFFLIFFLVIIHIYIADVRSRNAFGCGTNAIEIFFACPARERTGRLRPRTKLSYTSSDRKSRISPPTGSTDEIVDSCGKKPRDKIKPRFATPPLRACNCIVAIAAHVTRSTQRLCRVLRSNFQSNHDY